MSLSEKSAIGVLDFGGQYAHLIASRLRRLGSYSEIIDPLLSDTHALKKYGGLIYSGGPASVYEKDAPHANEALLKLGVPILGICYGHQLMMHQLGGEVIPSSSKEYGRATLHVQSAEGIFKDEVGSNQVWMSHGDEVVSLPKEFTVLASTDDCKYAAVADVKRNFYGVQFHPEVNDSVRGDFYLRNFIRICNLEGTWTLEEYLKKEILEIQNRIRDRKIFLLVSGGVDSTVAFALLAKAVHKDHLRALFVNTGFMRQNEIEDVQKALSGIGVNLEVEDAADLFYEKLKNVYEPEAKRKIIGELFIDVQESVTTRLGLDPEHWYFAQGTIYPDTIESGGTKNSQTIKTHHNRVARIQKMIDAGRVIEPIRDLYKDEVRRLGLLLGLPEEIVYRHPFPGPGLAVRTLCLSTDDSTLPQESGMFDFVKLLEEHLHAKDECDALMQKITQLNLTASLLPVHSVGVQGDKRSYARPVALFQTSDKTYSWDDLQMLAALIPNKILKVNRVLFCTRTKEGAIVKDAPTLCAQRGVCLTRERISLLQQVDAAVHRFQNEKKIYDKIWQFPVVLVPVYRKGKGKGESIVLRPICSIDAMTATFYPMSHEHLKEISEMIIAIEGVDAVYFDLTSKPPGTIEWE